MDSQSNIKNQVSKLEKNLTTFESQKTEKIGQIDDYFDKLLVKVAEAREALKAEFTGLCESKNIQMTVCLNEYKKYLTRLDSAKNKLEKMALEISRLWSQQMPLNS